MAAPVAIELVTTDERSAATKSQLERLVQRYDLSPWLHTRRVAIEAGTIPHSHPVLTLNTRHVEDDRLLLSTFLHEQLHWFLTTCPDASVEGAFDDLRSAFPDAPEGFPEAAEDEESTYLHLIVNYLEHEAVATVLGADVATSVTEFWASDHYRWMYRMVLERGEDIRSILENHGLLHGGGSKGEQV